MDDYAAHADAAMPPRTMREELRNPAKKRGARAQASGDPSQDAGDGIASLERRLAMLENSVSNIADIVERHEISLREREDALASVGQSVLALCKRIDESEKLRADEAAELRAALADASMRLNGLEADRAANRSRASAVAPSAPEPAFTDQPLKWGREAEPTLSAEAPPQVAESEQKNSQIQNYLSVARSAANAETGSNSKRSAQSPRRANKAQFVIFSCAAPLMVVAAATFAINRNPVTAEPVPVPASFVPADHVAALPPPPAPALPPPPQLIITPPAEPTPDQLASAEPMDMLQEKATAGDPGAEREVGLKYLTGDSVAVNEEEAARWLLRASYRGEPTAEYWLGTLYARGHGVPADMFQANHWYSASAKLGNRNAMHRLAVANFAGLGMENNPEQAARWFTQAAQLGLPDSQFDLAVMYERGTGVQQSLVDAYKWYAAAAAQGDKQAASRVEVLAKELKPEELAVAMRAAAEFKPDLTDGNGIAANLTP
jgi:TPR repeat protein